MQTAGIHHHFVLTVPSTKNTIHCHHFHHQMAAERSVRVERVLLDNNLRPIWRLAPALWSQEQENRACSIVRFMVTLSAIWLALVYFVFLVPQLYYLIKTGSATYATEVSYMLALVSTAIFFFQFEYLVHGNSFVTSGGKWRSRPQMIQTPRRKRWEISCLPGRLLTWLLNRLQLSFWTSTVQSIRNSTAPSHW